MKPGWSRSLLAAAAAALVAAGMTVAADTSAEIRAASSKMLDASGTPENQRAGVQTLVDILGRMAEQEKGLSPAASARIGEAAAAFRKDPSPEGKGVAALNEAWREISGKAFAIPAGVTGASGAAALARTRIDACLSALHSGNGAGASRNLLEALLLVLTPMEIEPRP